MSSIPKYDIGLKSIPDQNIDVKLVSHHNIGVKFISDHSIGFLFIPNCTIGVKSIFYLSIVLSIFTKGERLRKISNEIRMQPVHIALQKYRYIGNYIIFLYS